MTDIPGASLIGLLAGLALNALVRWSERPRREPTEPVANFDPWMFTSSQTRHLDDTARTDQSTVDRHLPEGRSVIPMSTKARAVPPRRNTMALSWPDPTYESEATRQLYPSMPLFEGFPYLVIRVVPAMYHVTLVPADASELELVLLARTQWRANRLEVCLMTGVDRAWFISSDGRDVLAQTPARGDTLVTGLLKSSGLWADIAELQTRQRHLDAIAEAHRRKGGYILGDLTKGGRDATADDVGRLAGAGPEGRPRGLERCPTCGDWRGRCLDPSPNFASKVMAVHCRCQNGNRCAACGGFLDQRKLNANYYNPRDGQIWHVPGFSGFKHRCPPDQRPRR
jgi:hypothetical protein